MLPLCGEIPPPQGGNCHDIRGEISRGRGVLLVPLSTQPAAAQHPTAAPDRSTILAPCSAAPCCCPRARHLAADPSAAPEHGAHLLPQGTARCLCPQARNAAALDLCTLLLPLLLPHITASKRTAPSCCLGAQHPDAALLLSLGTALYSSPGARLPQHVACSSKPTASHTGPALVQGPYCSLRA